VIRGVHHINLLVGNLEEAMQQYQQQLGVVGFEVAELPGRGVRTARFMAGDTTIVLVEPVAEGEPMRQLQSHGEGLFLLSFEVDDLDAAGERVVAGGGQLVGEPRLGLEGWRVMDIDARWISGGQLQLTQVKK